MYQMLSKCIVYVIFFVYHEVYMRSITEECFPVYLK